MYSEDSNDQIPYASALNTPYGWITGDLDFEPSNRSNWDVEIDIKKSPLWIFRSPGFLS